jgi:dolichol-phosphate mannosyltransferase
MRALSLLSVVAPFYDEEEIVREFYARATSALEGVPFELVLVNDGSTDETPALLDSLAATDPRVKVVHLARNFGHQNAITAGLDHAKGDAVVTIDSDLQDPPELIAEMLDRWRAGADVVYAVRRRRDGETRFKLTTASWFYRFFTRVSGVGLENNSGDYRLLDRHVVEVLMAMPERHRFLRGMTVWVGFTQAAVPYDRDARFAGETKYPLRKMLRFALDAIFSFSYAPLRMATVLGFLFAGAAFIGLPLVVIARYADIYVPGVSSLLFVILLLGGIQLITVGIIGEYVGRIYDEVKHRPLYVVRARRNTEAPAPGEAYPPEELTAPRT